MIADPIEGPPASWASAKLGETLPLKYGKSLVKAARVKTGTLPVYGSSGVVGFHTEPLVRGPSLIVGRKGSVGTVYLSNGSSWPIDTTYFIEGSPSTNLAFFHYLLGFLELGNLDRSTAIPGLSRSDYNEIEISVPPLPEQHRIVAEIDKQLTRLDTSVAALERVRANLKRYRASVLKTACEGRLVPTEAELARVENRDYEPAGRLLQRILAERRARLQSQPKRRGKYKEPAPPDTSALPERPEGWVWAKFPQLGELNRGKSKHRPRNDPRLLGGPYPFLQTGDIKHSRGLVTRHSQTYTEFGLAQSRLWPSGTLCITIAANIAETGILTYPACFPDSVVGFVCDDNPIITKFLELFVRTERDNLERFAPATAQKNINLQVLSELAVPLPPLTEQHRIVAEVERRLSVVQQAETVVGASLKRAGRLRQSILKQAFSGKLVPQDPNDEPASALLERIRTERAAAETPAKRQRKPRRRRSKPAPARQLGFSREPP